LRTSVGRTPVNTVDATGFSETLTVRSAIVSRLSVVNWWSMRARLIVQSFSISVT
jgi:hypothetical protein